MTFYTDTKEYKAISLTDDLFMDSLYAVHSQLEYYNLREFVSDINVKNFNTQSIANRANGMRVKSTIKVKNRITEVSNPIGFIPARIGIGYNADDKITHEKTLAGQLWTAIKTRQVNQSNLESLSWIGYFTCQLISGQLISGESVFKLDALNTMLTILKPAKLEISIFPRIKDDSIVYAYNLSQVKNLITANEGRVSLIHSLKIRENTRKGKKGKDKTLSI